MISQNSHVSSEESFETQMRRKAGCHCSNTVVISYTKRMIPVVRDFPQGCGPRGILATQCCQHVVQSESSSSSSFYDSLDSEDLVVTLPDDGLESVSSNEVERKDVPQALDTTKPIDLLKTSDREATELPEKVVSKFMPKGYKPQKRVLAIRDYPIPPRRFQTSFSEDLVQSELPGSSPRYESESAEDKTKKALDDIEQIDMEVTSEYETKELSKEAELEFGSSRYDLESEDSMVSMYNISLNSFGLSEDEEGIDIPKVTDSMALIDQSETSEHESTDLTEDIASNFTPPVLPLNTIDSTIDFPKGCQRRGLNHKLSDAEDPLLEVLSDSEECCSTNACKCNLQDHENLSGRCSNRFPENGPSTTEKPVPKLIVTALIAAPIFPWSKKKRASRSNTTRDTNKSKRKRH